MELLPAALLGRRCVEPTVTRFVIACNPLNHTVTKLLHSPTQFSICTSSGLSGATSIGNISTLYPLSTTLLCPSKTPVKQKPDPNLISKLERVVGDLTVFVIAPAGHAACAGDGATVISTRTDRGKAAGGGVGDLAVV